MNYIIKEVQTSHNPLRAYIYKPELYDRVYISELEDTPYNLYGAKYNRDNLFKMSHEIWKPIKKEDASKYDIIIQRSILYEQKHVFVIIKLGEEMREDLR